MALSRLVTNRFPMWLRLRLLNWLPRIADLPINDQNLAVVSVCYMPLLGEDLVKLMRHQSPIFRNRLV